MEQVWIPGGAGAHEELVARIHSQIDRFARDNGLAEAVVEVQLEDGTRFCARAISADPGFGFLTITVHGEEDDPDEAIVRVNSIDRIELFRAVEERGGVGFALPESTS